MNKHSITRTGESVKHFSFFLLAYLFDNKISHLVDKPSAKFRLNVISNGRAVMFEQARNSRHANEMTC